MSRLRRHAIVLPLLLGALVSPAFGQWYKEYDGARAAVRRRQWTIAIDRLERAIAEKPASEAGAATGGPYTVDYFPYYYLGVCYMSLGDLERARAMFERELREGQVADSAEVRPQLELRLREVRDRLARQPSGEEAPPPEPAPERPPERKAEPGPRIEPRPQREPAPPEPPREPPAEAAPSPGLDLDAARTLLAACLDLAARGGYREAADRLAAFSGAAPEGGRPGALLHAFAGSLYLDAFVLGGGGDDTLERRAREQLGLAASADPAFELPAALFAPRVRALYDETRRATAR